MKTTKRATYLELMTGPALACAFLLSACTSYQSTSSAPAFRYDAAALPGAKPWTSEMFKNNPDDFQFAIIGDRTGGANVAGTFKLAMDQTRSGMGLTAC